MNFKTRKRIFKVIIELSKRINLCISQPCELYTLFFKHLINFTVPMHRNNGIKSKENLVTSE